jgi:hypothetical protein
MIVWPTVNDQEAVQLLIGYEALLVTVTVTPKSGGPSDGVCQPTVYAAPHAAPVSAGALGADRGRRDRGGGGQRACGRWPPGSQVGAIRGLIPRANSAPARRYLSRSAPSLKVD